MGSGLELGAWGLLDSRGDGATEKCHGLNKALSCAFVFELPFLTLLRLYTFIHRTTLPYALNPLIALSGRTEA